MAPRHIRAVEFRPDNRRIVHHAFVEVDYQKNARRLEGLEGEPGFGGMRLPAGVRVPKGYFLSWQPGKLPLAEPPGFGWTLQPGEEIVLQTHLRPTGRPEELQAEIGLYFTDTPPTNSTFVVGLASLDIDIPAGTHDYVLEDSFVLPVAVELLSVLPHAHYLGKQLEGYARLPDGSTRSLIRIPNWDFNWQGDYRYARPVHLPAGTTLQMRYLYDNSAANPRNPNQPPKAVRYGLQSTDEMGELWFQVQLEGASDAARLEEASHDKQIQIFTRHDQLLLQRRPHDAQARTDLGLQQLDRHRVAEAVTSFRAAVRDDAAYDQPHYYLGFIFRSQNRLPEARAELEEAVRLNPKHAQALGNLGIVLSALGDLDGAEARLSEAARLDPADQVARAALEELRNARAKLRRAP